MGKLSALWDIAKKEGADLADDAASRMARAAEQGYDTSKVMYHGTGSDVSEFDPLKMGRTDDGWFGKGFYFSPDPSIANQYANDGTPNVIPAYLRAEKPYDWRQMEGRGMRLGTPEERYGKTREILEKGYDSVDVYDDVVQLGADEKLPDDVWAAIVARSQDMDNPVLPRDLVEKGLRQGMTTKADFARYYGEELANKMPMTRTLRERVVFDPSQVRSVNATFDPAKKDSANLLAGLGGAAVLGGSLAPEDAEAGVGAATTTALAPEMYRQMEETRRVLSDFATLRAPKASFWKQKRDELLELAGAGVAAATSGYETLQDKGFIPQGTPFADFFSQRSADSQEPVRAVSALAALVATQDPQKAAGVYRMPQEQIADEAGGLVTDYLSQAGYPGIAPAAGTAVNVGVNMAGF